VEGSDIVEGSVAVDAAVTSGSDSKDVVVIAVAVTDATADAPDPDRLTDGR